MVKHGTNVRIASEKCCGFHVDTCAKLVAIIGIVLCALCLINVIIPSISISLSSLFFQESTAVKYQLIVLIVINTIAIGMFLINVLVLYGSRTEKPWAYMPYLVVNGIWIAFWLLIVLILFYMGNFAPHLVIDNLPRKDIKESTIQVSCNIMAILILFLNFIPMIFWLSVYRAYRYARHLYGGINHDSTALLN